MRSTVINIIRTAVFYSFVGFMLHVLGMTTIVASQLPEDHTLRDVKIKMSGDNRTLEQTFQLIEKQTDFRFFYMREDVPLDKKIEKLEQEESLYQVLQDFAKEFGLAFTRINNQIVVKKADPVQPETYKVSGVVRDGSTHEPLVFASIIVKGKQNGAATDTKGKFLLNLPQGNDTLRCSYVGYKAVEIPISVDKDIQLSINLFAMDVLLQDVTIYAYQGNDNELAAGNPLSLQSEKIKKSTSLFPDVLRSVQMLPGVSTNNEFNAKFNVRGGNPDENLVLVNGTQVYDPYHLKEAPNYSIGIINNDLVNKMDLMTGGFPARYGDKMSSVLNIEFREGDKEHYTGTASLSMTDANIVAEGPVSKEGSFIIGARKTYLEYILKLASQKMTVIPSFYDIQGVVDYSLSPNHKLLLKFIHAGDEFSENPTVKIDGPNLYYYSSNNSEIHQWIDTTAFQTHYFSTLFALQHVNIMSSSTIWKTELSLYDERESEEYSNSHSHQFFGNKPMGSLFYNSLSVQTYHNELLIRTLELNSTLDHQCSEYYGIKTGMRYQAITYEEDQRYLRTIDQTGNFDFIHNTIGNFPDTITTHQVDNPRDALDNQMHTRSWKFGGYIEHIIQLSRPLLVNVGGRMDYFDLNKELTWSPRLNLAYHVADGLRIRGAWGYYYQSPNYLQVAYPEASDTNTQSQKAIHYVVGADYTVAGAPEERSFLKIKMESFYKQYIRLMSAAQTSWGGKAYYPRKNDATGYSKGIDLYVMYSIHGFYGWVSYSYLEAMQDIMNDSTGVFPRNTDQKHTLALVGDFDLGSRWNLAMRYTYGSGYPYTPQSARYNNTTNQWNWSSGAPNSERLPSYSCMDMRITKDFEMFGLETSVFLDVSNVLMSKNILSYQYYINNNAPEKDGVNLPPLIPSIGMSVRF